MASSDDCKFLLSCLMNSVGKIDFEAVARETGYTNPRSASNRLSAIKKNTAAAAPNPTNDPTTVGREAKITKRKATPRKGKKSLKRAAGEGSDSANESEGKEVESKAKILKVGKEA